MSPRTYLVWVGGKPSVALTGLEVRNLLDLGQINKVSPMMVVGDTDWLSVEDFLPDLPEKVQPRRPDVIHPPAIGQSSGRIIEPLFASQTAGFILLTIGLLMILFYFFTDTSVPVDGGRNVNNLGLMNDQLCGVVAGGFIMVTGAIFIAAGSKYRIIS